MSRGPYSFRRMPGPHDSGAWRVLDAAGVCCGVFLLTVQLRHEQLGLDRVRAGLNGAGPVGVSARTWSWKRSPSSTPRRVFMHNGWEVAELGLDGHSADVLDEMAVRVVDALNEDRGPADPFPEPLPAESFKPWQVSERVS